MSISNFQFLPRQEAFLQFADVPLLKYGSVYLAEPPGGGKTLSSIALTHKHQADRITVLTSRNIIPTWVEQVKKWVPILNNHFNTNWQPSFIFQTYESVHKLPVPTKQTAPQFVILDEVHKIKQPLSGKQSQRAKNTFRYLRQTLAKRIYLSGTPFNRPYDLWSILRFEKLFFDWKAFITHYCGAYQDMIFTYGGPKLVWTGLDGAQNIEELRQRLADWMFVGEDDSESLVPSITRKVIYTKENKARQRLTKYLGLSDDALQNAVLGLGAGFKVPFEEVAAARKEAADKKLPFAKKYIIERLETSKPLIVFAHHQHIIRELDSHISSKTSYNVATIFGGNTVKINAENLEKFHKGEVDCLILSLGSGSEGLTLIESNVCVFVEFPWNYAQLNQAEKRILRVGQTKPVTYEFITAPGTLDHRILEILLEKKQTFESFMTPTPPDKIGLEYLNH